MADKDEIEKLFQKSHIFIKEVYEVFPECSAKKVLLNKLSSISIDILGYYLSIVKGEEFFENKIEDDEQK